MIWYCLLCGLSKRHYPASTFCDDCERDMDRKAGVR